MTAVLAERPAPAPDIHTGGSLAIRSDQTAWTPDQQAVLQQSGIDNQVTGAELSAFLHLCQRTRLDPFSRQIYLIGRWDNRQGRKVYTPQTSIDGYRVIAHRAAAEAGHKLGYEDTLWCDASGKWRDVWLSDMPPAAAKVTVIRNGMRFSAVARHSEYVQTKKNGEPSGLWVKMPTTMTAKCAEALALRMAFPHDLAGVYTAEEMAQADNPPVVEVEQVRRAAPGPDEWSTPPPVAEQMPQQPQQPQQPRRDYIAEVMSNAGRDQATFKEICRAAHKDGASVGLLTMLDDLDAAFLARDVAAVRKLYDAAKAEGAPAEHLARIATIGQSKPAAAPPSSKPQPEPSDVDPAAEAAYDGPRNGGMPHPEQRTEEQAAADAENALRLAASRANLTELDNAFHRVYGLPIEQATAQQLDEFRARIENAAGGAQ